MQPECWPDFNGEISVLILFLAISVNSYAWHAKVCIVATVIVNLITGNVTFLTVLDGIYDLYALTCV